MVMERDSWLEESDSGFVFRLLVSGKKCNQDLSCNRKCLVLSKNQHKEERMESEFWNGQCSSFPTLILYDPFSTLLPYLLKQLGSDLYTSFSAAHLIPL